MAKGRKAARATRKNAKEIRVFREARYVGDWAYNCHICLNCVQAALDSGLYEVSEVEGAGVARCAICG